MLFEILSLMVFSPSRSRDEREPFRAAGGRVSGRSRAGVPGDRRRGGGELRGAPGAGRADRARCCAPPASSRATGWRCRCEKSVAGVCLYLAVLQAGAVYVPLNTGYTPAEVGHFLADAEPKVVVCDPGGAWRAGAAGRGAGLDLHARARRRGDADRRRRRGCRRSGRWRRGKGGDLAAILYTSGTTGRSKGAMLTNDNLWSNVATLHAAWGLRPRRRADPCAAALPHPRALRGAEPDAPERRADDLAAEVRRGARCVGLLPRATVLMGVPTFYTRLLASPRLTREAAAGMRLFVSGSAPLLAATHAEFEARTGQRILERYGMTETGMNASNPLAGERRAGTVGPALPGVELRVCGPDGRELPAGEVGVLEVRGPNVFAGYWRMPEKTAEEMRPDGFFVTGDLARIDGRRLRDDRRAGQGPDHLRRAQRLSQGGRAGARRAAGRDRERGGRRAAPGLRRGGGGGGDRRGDRRRRGGGAARAGSRRSRLPKRVSLVDELPRNAMGKVQKNLLRERFAGLFGGYPIARPNAGGLGHRLIWPQPDADGGELDGGEKVVVASGGSPERQTAADDGRAMVMEDQAG